jgi:transcriptional regulator with XRE-family HTH domain
MSDINGRSNSRHTSRSGNPPHTAERGTANAAGSDTHIGFRLRMRRVILGISQRQLADVLGVSPQLIQKYERAITRISANRLHELSRILRVEIGYFFEQAVAPDLNANGSHSGAVDAEEIWPLEAQTLPAETLELVKWIYRIPDEATRRQLLVLIKSVANRGSSAMKATPRADDST